MDDDFVVLELKLEGNALGSILRTRSFEQASTLSTSDILVARPGNRGLDEIATAYVVNTRDAVDAARDPTKIVSRKMPLSVITPMGAAEFVGAGLPNDADALARAVSARQSWGINSVLGPKARDLNGEGVKVCVLDTGIDADHEAFAEIRTGIRAVQRNFTNLTDSNASDGQGHGTHCAGTIFGRDVDGVRIGVARGVTDIFIGKVLDDEGRGETQWLIEALKWAHAKSNIISMSLGFDFTAKQKQLMNRGYAPELATSMTLKAYRDSLKQFEVMSALIRQSSDQSPSGALIVAASGNESRRHISRDHVIDVGVPACAAPEIVSVGAVYKTDGSEIYTIAPFSNINPLVCAPGVGIVSAKSGGGLVAMNGTSMACPHVAGVAALWWQWISQNTGGQFKADDVRARLQVTVADAHFDANVTIYDRGSGLVQAPQAP